MTLPIINQPQVAILSTDGIKKRPVVVTGPDGDDTIAIHHTGHARAHVGPPRVRRRVRRRVPAAHAATCSSSTTGKTSSTDAAGRAGSVGCPTARPTGCSGRCTSAPTDDYLLLLEHPHVYTLGTTRRSRARARAAGDRSAPSSCTPTAAATSPTTGPASSSATRSSRLPEWRDGLRDVVAYVRALEDVLIDALADFGIEAHREPRFTGVWVGDEKIAAIGVKVPRGRTRHGFALNVDPDLGDVRPHRAVRHPRPRRHVDGRGARRPRPRCARSSTRSSRSSPARVRRRVVERQDVVWREHPDDLSAFTAPRCGGVDAAVPAGAVDAGAAPRSAGRSGRAGIGRRPGARRPEWMRVKADLGADFRETKRLVQQLDLHTVCEEAGCPNIYECWADRTATFMILGDRCTRACGFCLVDTRKPLPLDPDEPDASPTRSLTLGLEHAVITSVARDDLADGGAAGVRGDDRRGARAAARDTTVEVLIPDCKGDADALDVIFAARPDVLNHNLETVARLQRAARPSAALLPLARAAGPGQGRRAASRSRASSSGMGETADELRGAIADLRNVGVDILTLGQYLRPSAPAPPGGAVVDARRVRRARATTREGLGFRHVESGPLVRSSYHAKRRQPTPARHPGTRLAVARELMYAERLAAGAGAHAASSASTSCCCRPAPTCPYFTGYEAMPLERLTMLVRARRPSRRGARDPHARGAARRRAARRVRALRAGTRPTTRSRSWPDSSSASRPTPPRPRSATTRGPGSCSTCSARCPTSRSAARPTSPDRCAW